MTATSDWEARYRDLIAKGRAFPLLRASERTDANRAFGCLYKLWVVRDVVDGKTCIRGESDSLIVRGLIAVLAARLEGTVPGTVSWADVEEHFTNLGLADHLAPHKRSGFVLMVGRVLQKETTHEL